MKSTKSGPTAANINEMLNHYITAALWSSTDENTGHPMDRDYGPSDLTAAAKAKMKADVAKFLKANFADVDGRFKKAGHDFWLTRNGHGAGFWDGDWPEDAGERLTKASKKFGEQSLYVHRKKVHVA